MLALLQEPRLVHGQNPVRVPLHDEVAQVVADRIRVPAGRAQEPLHRVGTPVPAVLGQRPAVLTLHIREQSGDEHPGRGAWLDPGEPARNSISGQRDLNFRICGKISRVPREAVFELPAFVSKIPNGEIVDLVRENHNSDSLP